MNVFQNAIDQLRKELISEENDRHNSMVNRINTLLPPATKDVLGDLPVAEIRTPSVRDVRDISPG